MRMPADDDVEAGRRGIDIQLLKIVDDVDGCGTGFSDCGHRQRRGPVSSVKVSPDGDYRSDCFEDIEDLGLSHIAGVDDQLRPRQDAQRLVAQQTVRVRDQADEMSVPIHITHAGTNFIFRDFRDACWIWATWFSGTRIS
jgi:hypothetical protein